MDSAPAVINAKKTTELTSLIAALTILIQPNRSVLFKKSTMISNVSLVPEHRGGTVSGVMEDVEHNVVGERYQVLVSVRPLP